ncbi:unnamed protein product [Larinioides sclopetarius]|uniref:Uncharacterized protein n=1 Tax=Larinioides sclopetarius TaxID=280406 RepID=A0AAV2B4B6_9ARAC
MWREDSVFRRGLCVGDSLDPRTRPLRCRAFASWNAFDSRPKDPATGYGTALRARNGSWPVVRLVWIVGC